MERKKCKTRKTLKDEAVDAKIGVDTAASEPGKGSENLETRKKVDQFTVNLTVASDSATGC